ncbi:hypothetical protein KY336_00725 [Candidatus Woesearchaeota archaeon]|nr:hypothetical protein [Candidatus Woesearchaeota archaeon]
MVARDKTRFLINVFVIAVLVIILSISASAASSYWIGDSSSDDYVVHSNTLFILKGATNRIGIGLSSPGYALHVQSSGAPAVRITSTNGVALEARGTSNAIFGYTTALGSAGVYGYATSGSGVNYGVYGQATTGYSGYFTGGPGVWANNREVYHKGNCDYNYAAGSTSVNCDAGGDKVVGGGCDCSCGDGQTIYSYPSSDTQWVCNCRNCNAGDHNSWIICCAI